jgi:hypothetical protein
MLHGLLGGNRGVFVVVSSQVVPACLTTLMHVPLCLQGPVLLPRAGCVGASGLARSSNGSSGGFGGTGLQPQQQKPQQ